MPSHTPTPSLTAAAAAAHGKQLTKHRSEIGELLEKSPTPMPDDQRPFWMVGRLRHNHHNPHKRNTLFILMHIFFIFFIFVCFCACVIAQRRNSFASFGAIPILLKLTFKKTDDKIFYFNFQMNFGPLKIMLSRKIMVSEIWSKKISFSVKKRSTNARVKKIWNWHHFSVPRGAGREELTTSPVEILPWKREGVDLFCPLAMKQREFPLWIKNKEYIEQSSPSSTFIGMYHRALLTIQYTHRCVS